MMKTINMLKTSSALFFLLTFCNMLTHAQQIAPVALKWLNDTPKKPTGVSWGVPWPQGQVKKKAEFTLTRPDGSSMPVQSWTLATWPDGSVKWTGLAAVADSTTNTVALKVMSSKSKNVLKTSLQVSEDEQSVHINTGVTQCVIAKSGSTIIPSLTINGKQIAADGQLQCILQNKPDGNLDDTPAKQHFTGSITRVTVEQNGPVRAVVRVNGQFKTANGSRSFLPFILRFYFYSGVSNIRLLHTIIFDGDDQKDFIKGLGLSFSVPLKGTITKPPCTILRRGRGNLGRTGTTLKWPTAKS